MLDDPATIAAARVLDEKLANWSGGRRYTCPSYEIERVSDGVRIAVPGFGPFAAVEQHVGADGLWSLDGAR